MNNLFKNIPPAQALHIEISEWNGRRAELRAPLAPNLNDKGTAFAGSIDSLLNLAGWSAITLALRDAGMDADVMIVQSETEYCAAVQSDMTAVSELSAEEGARITSELQECRRSRVALTSQLRSANKPCATMSAHYAILARHSQP